MITNKPYFALLLSLAAAVSGLFSLTPSSFADEAKSIAKGHGNAQASQKQPMDGKVSVSKESDDAIITESTKPLVWNVEKIADNSFKILKGSQFKVKLQQDVNSDTSQSGQPVSCELVDNLTFGSVLLARAGAPLKGKITEVAHSRRTIKAYVPSKNWLDAQGRIKLTFTSILTPAGNVLPLQAVPAKKTRVIQVKPTKAKLIANKHGAYVLVYATKKFTAIDLAITAATFTAGPPGIVAGALASGVIGTANRNYAANKQLEDGEEYSRTKGFVMGAARSLPGSQLITGVATSGNELNLHSGDMLTLELQDDLVATN